MTGESILFVPNTPHSQLDEIQAALFSNEWRAKKEQLKYGLVTKKMQCRSEGCLEHRSWRFLWQEKSLWFCRDDGHFTVYEDIEPLCCTPETIKSIRCWLDLNENENYRKEMPVLHPSLLSMDDTYTHKHLMASCEVASKGPH